MIVITDDSQGSTAATSQLKIQLLLQQIGILILVYEDGLQATGEGCEGILLQSLQDRFFQCRKVQQLTLLHGVMVVAEDLIEQLSGGLLFRRIGRLQESLPVQQVMAAPIQQRAEQAYLSGQGPAAFAAAAEAEQQGVELRILVAAILQQCLSQQRIGQCGVSNIGWQRGSIRVADEQLLTQAVDGAGEQLLQIAVVRGGVRLESGGVCGQQLCQFLSPQLQS